MTATKPASISEWLQLAYEGADDCPPPEAYLPEELAGLDGAARERLESHAAGCVACAAERELASGFELPVNLSGSERRQVRGIAQRLERRAPHAKSAGWLSRLPSWGALMRAPAFQLAAAAALVVGIGVGLRDNGPPPLGDAGGETVMRSSALRVEAPIGELAELPSALSWETVADAAHYVATVQAVDDTELWRAETVETSMALDAALRAQLLPAVSYTWRVEAFDASGARIAWSPATTFNIRPAAAVGDSQ